MHAAYTIDGGLIVSFYGTHQEIGTYVANNLRKPQGPYVAYTHDDTPGIAYPYTVWHAFGNETRGEQCKDFDEAADMLDRIYGR